MDPSLVALLVSVLLAILASVFSIKYYYVKGKASRLNALISEATKCRINIFFLYSGADSV